MLQCMIKGWALIKLSSEEMKIMVKYSNISDSSNFVCKYYRRYFLINVGIKITVILFYSAVLLCWVTQDFELYAAFDPLADKVK